MVDAGQLKLSWFDNATNENGFNIERSVGATGAYVQLASVGANITTYYDTTVTANTTYCYRVRAFNADGFSVYSNDGCATTPPAATNGSTLTVSKHGNGSGTVTAPGIDCGTDCSESYLNGTSVVLTALAASGSTFAGWAGAGCSTGTVMVNQDRTCTATFNLIQNLLSTLMVSKSGNGSGMVMAPGIDCGTDCSESYPNGTSVVLTALAASGSIFAGWSSPDWNSGKCLGPGECSVTMTSSIHVTATFVNDPIDKVGVYRPSTGEWFLDRNGNGSWDGCAIDICVQSFSDTEALPVVGDWDGSGFTKLGLFMPRTAHWRLDLKGDHSFDGCAADVCQELFGAAGDIPLAGRWKTFGSDRVGTFRPSTGNWYLDANGDGILNNCRKDYCRRLRNYVSGDLPVVGDWTGDGLSQVGLYRPSTEEWFLDLNGNRLWNGCRRDACIGSFGTPEGLPVTGDWSGDGKSKIGVFRPATGEWMLDLNGNGEWDGCEVDLCLSGFGATGDIPVVGSW